MLNTRKLDTKILLCYPTPSTTSPQKNPALSVFYPGAALENAGYGVEYWDGRFENEENLLGKLKSAKYVGVSSMTGEQLTGAKKVLILAKKLNKKTIFGGIHASLLPEECIKEPYIDYIVVNEGEKTIVELVDALEGKNEVGFGVMTKSGFKGHQAQLKGNEIPSPITPKTIGYFEKSYPNDIMLPTSRGCPYKCGFCYNTKFHQSKYRPITLDRWEKDLEKLHGIRWLQMGEDWVGSKNRVLEIANILYKRKIKWMPSLRADQIDNELVFELSNMGCTGVSIGIESGSPTVLNQIINKKETIDDFINSAQILSKAKMKPQYYFIIGFPGESKKDRALTFDFADKLCGIHQGNVIIVFYSFTPLPGTPLFEKAKQYKIPLPESLDDWSNYSLNHSYSKELANLYHIAGFTFHRTKGDKTDRNFPGMKRLLITPFELVCILRWRLRFWKYFDFEKLCIEKLLKWAARESN